VRLKIFCVFIFCFLLFFPSSQSFAQVKQEKEERIFEADVQSEKSDSQLDMQAGVFVGYDSNVRLDGARKGDSFQEALFALWYKKPLGEDVGFKFNYILDHLNYSEVTKNSNLLNQLVFEINRFVSFFTIGVGYDFAYLYYPNYEDGDFMFHKWFFYIGGDLNEKVYHQLKYYYGQKRYLRADAIGDASGSHQSKERFDKRQHLEYSLKYSPTSDLTLRLSLSDCINDSNARYVDYYDYQYPSVSCGLDYKLKPDLYLLLDYAFRLKDYKSREVTTKTYKQEDNSHYADMGFLYYLTDKSSLSLNYTYRETSSNDSFSEYSESVFTCGWQYYF